MNKVYFSDEFEIEDLGEIEEWVYDIEVEDNHNFFANDILVHNSFYVIMDPFVDAIAHKNFTSDEIVDYLDNICKKLIEPKLKEIYAEMAEYMGVYQNTMNMDRECIAHGAFWKAKKAYTMLVYDLEGYRFPEPYHKITGIKVVRSDTPAKVKPILKEFLMRILRGEKVRSKVEQWEKEIKETWEAEEMASPKRLNVWSKYYEPDEKPDISSINWFGKNTPTEIRGGSRYNALLNVLNLADEYPEIQDGESIKFLWLKEENPYSINNISFPDILPPEFELHDYIDKPKQYMKIAGKFFNDIVEIIGEKDSLDDDYDFDLF